MLNQWHAEGSRTSVQYPHNGKSVWSSYCKENTSFQTSTHFVTSHQISHQAGERHPHFRPSYCFLQTYHKLKCDLFIIINDLNKFPRYNLPANKYTHKHAGIHAHTITRARTHMHAHTHTHTHTHAHTHAHATDPRRFFITYKSN